MRLLFPVILLLWWTSSCVAYDKLFSSDEVLELTISGETNSLFRDKSDDMQYHKMSMSYFEADGLQTSIPLKIKTRGNFRRTSGACSYPPLLLNFSRKNTPENSLFFGQNKVKLVLPCSSEKYVVREYMTYKMHNMLTEHSFQVRLVRVTFENTKNSKTRKPVYGFLIENESTMAERNDAKLLKRKGLSARALDQGHYLESTLFQYMIGNTDWSMAYGHNMKLIYTNDSKLCPIPYDFDHAGMVSAPYANPPEQLNMTSVRERRYRGVCIEDMAVFEPILARFQQLKPDFYKLYTDHPQLEEKCEAFSTRFLDSFYTTLDNPKALQKALSFPCQNNASNRVVIKGLDGDPKER